MKIVFKIVIIICIVCFILFIYLFYIDFIKQEIIYYIYDGITITRVNKGHDKNESYFYYGHYDGNIFKYPKSYLKAGFSGFNGIMTGYLIFNIDDIVKFRKGEGDFSKIGNDSQLTFSSDLDNYNFRKWHDSIIGNSKNIVRIHYSIELEKLENKEIYNTQVKAIYPE